MRRKKKTSDNKPQSLVTKELRCAQCSRSVSVDDPVTAVICWECACKKVPLARPVVKAEPEIKRARGWKFMAVYVDTEGNVFHKGIEQQALKGTLPPSVIAKKPKKSQFEKNLEELKKETKLAKKYERKQKNKRDKLEPQLDRGVAENI